MYKTINHCQCCLSKKTQLALKLANTPLEDNFSLKPEVHEYFPLELYVCAECSFAYLKQQVLSELSYTNYQYNTAVTVGLTDHYEEFAASVVTKFKLGQKSLAVDIGSNDGTMIEAFQKAGITAIGVEPAEDIALLSTKKGRKTIPGYFDAEQSIKIKHEFGKASVITANYMFANIPDFETFLNGVNTLLNDDGVFIIQTGYHPKQFDLGMFDYIYHEHFHYFTIKSLQKLLGRFGLNIIDIEHQDPKGGSIRLYAMKSERQKPNSKIIEEFIKFESDNKWDTLERYSSLRSFISEKKKEVNEALEKEKSGGKTIIAFGASHSTTVLIHEYGLSDFIEYIIDDNENKHDTFSPGLNIPVKSPSWALKTVPDICIIIAWQHQEKILKRHKALSSIGCKFLCVMPELRFSTET